MTKRTTPFSQKYLYLISFIEGGVVMVAEIAGAKLLTPFFGASLYSWAATLSITLLALMSGYYYGGYITTKPGFPSGNKVLWVFLFSGIAVFLMPSIGHIIMQKTISFSFFAGLLISELAFLFIPVFLMGMISPMIVFHVTEKAEQSGRSAGNIYAISTSGGILFTLVFGFFIVPLFGISVPVRILGLAVTFIGITFILNRGIVGKRYPLLLVIGFTALVVLFARGKVKAQPMQNDRQVIASSEGLLGELKVIDQISHPQNSDPVKIRKLRANNVQQNYVFAEIPGQSLMYYVNFTKQLLHAFPKKNKALLLGLGAGSLYQILREQYHEVETVEIDQRIYDIGVRYFGMPEHNAAITDGRYYINTTEQKYDLIIVDVIIGESLPFQLLTLESFGRIRELLTDDGILILENGGLFNFSNNSFVPSVEKTLKASGLEVVMFNPVVSNSKELGDVLFVASKKKLSFDDFQLKNDVMVIGGSISKYLLSVNRFNVDGSEVLTDDKNSSDLMLKSHYFEVRKAVRKEMAKYKFWE
jgi:predicted membrane-bound spermidine synthase